VRIWIDTDVGDNPDDAVALLCAAAHPRIELVGVSTVAGDHERRAACVRTLVAAPLTRGDDPELARTVQAARPEAVVAIGPLTNLASLLDAAVDIPRLVVMGGLLGTASHRGADQRVEHNFARDPEAASRVLGAYVPAVVVPLDVTVSMRLGDAQLDRLLAVAPMLVPQVESWLAGLDRAGVAPEARRLCLHDPLALLTLTDPGLVRIEPHAVRVEADGRLTEADSAPVHQLVRAVDAPGAVDRVVGLLARAVG
jgi:pyrimidine-specific ribonucleoside hydrolase